ncbi:hypothetical protein COU56_04715 [Candidatus Pacearchaeota archaeon CG10_big_fil_rev_8_21_14_0_10_31_9]|nr:MAG: hypothetical protein COU56_04715 [Candidatus Pacearchaeota archaeon CG10_big_fil_rev_8_21_14_0_10_31_9]PIZ82777.1 MAG: hypothetical protein COX97_03020 [Candidatus Pacearchaeota archaeon CG_4_10_14_0_2_um_filter_05_32_18]
MFIVTQLIGLAVIHAYTPQQAQVEINGSLQNVTYDPLPTLFQQQESKCNIQDIGWLNNFNCIYPILIAFVIAIAVIFLLSRYKFTGLLRAWFFIVIVLVLWLTVYAFEILVPWEINYTLALIIPTIFSLVVAYFKVLKRNIIVHNISELLIYPGIAAVFVPILNIWTMIVLLLIISVYDAWAVWHSGFMQKMAHFQINELKVFGGFFVPYLSKRQRAELKKQKMLAAKSKIKKLKGKSMKVNLAILGGGDVVFPIITAGVILRSLGLMPSLIIVLFSTLALITLFLVAKKGKFYPAMPFITAGLLIGIGIAYLI